MKLVSGLSRKNTPARVATAMFLVCLVTAAFYGTSVTSQKVDATTRFTARPQLVPRLGHSSEVSAAIFSNDGRLVLTGSQDHTACLWETATGRQLRCFEGQQNRVSSVALSPDSRWALTGSFDTTVTLWDAATGSELRVFDTDFAVNGVAFSPDGRLILAGNKKGFIYLWNANTGEEIWRVKTKSLIVYAVAFLPDGQHFMADNVLWNTNDGTEVSQLDVPLPTRVISVAFPADGHLVVTGDNDGTARIWEIATGREVQRFNHPGLSKVAISPDGRRVATTGRNKSAQVWDAATGKQLWSLDHKEPVSAVAFSPDGGYVMTGCWDGAARLWNVQTGALMRTFEGSPALVGTFELSNDGRFIATQDGEAGIHVWDTGSGVEAWQLEKGGPAAFSPDSRLLAVGRDKTIRLCDAANGQELKRFEQPGEILGVAFSPNGQLLLTTGSDNTAYIWEAKTGKEIRRFFKPLTRLGSVAFSPDSGFIVIGSNGTAILLDVTTGQELKRFKTRAMVVPSVFSPDGQFVLTGGVSLTGKGDSAYLWGVTTGAETMRFDGHSMAIGAVAISPDQRFVLTGSWDQSARLWDITTGKEVRRFQHSSWVTAVSFTPDGREIVTSSKDGTTRFWSTATGQELCRLISFKDGTWTVVDSEGRFDTNNLDDNPGLSWVMPDDPMNPLPVEIFMRDYYVPGLLTRTLNGDVLAPVGALSKLNRVQPKVEIKKVVQEPDAPDLVTVTVEVAQSESRVQRDSKGGLLQTGVYDLRLFRNGQLVGQRPTVAPAEELASWRTTSRVGLNAQGRQLLEFKGIMLPRKAKPEEVEFSAYAFNEDRVKSPTDRKSFKRPVPLPTVNGRAYVITVGVSVYENKAWDLQFAAKDARLARQVIADGLSQTGDYDEIVPISLISDHRTFDQKTVEQPATKANFREVLALLSGLTTTPKLLKAMTGVGKLKKATPDDLVLIFFSSHGLYRKVQGHDSFYFLPFDIGPGERMLETPALFEYSISNEELAAWLRDVDAGEMILIANACQSEASVNTEGFKPGPLGNRSLGQLAYDKGMRILAASQSLSSAMEADELSASLLTQALISEGLQARLADQRPSDQKITLSEWLKYGAARVPKLYEAANYPEARTQRPVLFDFVRTKRETALTRWAAR